MRKIGLLVAVFVVIVLLALPMAASARIKRSNQRSRLCAVLQNPVRRHAE